MILRPDPGQDIFDTSVELHKVLDEGMRIVDWAQRDPLIGIPSIFGPIALLTWAFRRSRKESKLEDWNTR